MKLFPSQVEPPADDPQVARVLLNKVRLERVKLLDKLADRWREFSLNLSPGWARQQGVIKAAGNHLAKNAALLCDCLLNRHSDGALLAVVSRLWPQVPRSNGNQK